MARVVKRLKTVVSKKGSVKKAVISSVKVQPKKENVKRAKISVSASKKTEIHAGLRAPLLTLEGKSAGMIPLPEALFGAKVNKHLIAQAVRIYLSNQREGSANSKTRGEVRGSTRKIYKQKGTGRARHGGIRAPIFVGGGIAFGPRPHDFSMAFPKKMRKAALISALTSKFSQGDIVFIQGLEEIHPKTKEMAQVLKAIGISKGCILVGENYQTVIRSARNIKGIETIKASNLNTYNVVVSEKIIIPKGIVDVLEKTFIR